MKFEWDTTKARTNVAKHGVTFEQASAVFDDVNRVEFYRPRDGEDRFVTIGSTPVDILFVVYTERGAALRIISARKGDER